MSIYAKAALRCRGLYLICLIFLFLGVLMDALAPRLVSCLVDKVIAAGLDEGAAIMILLLFSCFLLRGVFKYVQEFSSDKISQSVRQDCRTALFSHILLQRGPFFQANRPGELMSRVRHDAENVGFAFGFIGVFLIEIVIHVVVMLSSLIALSWQVGLVCLTIMPLIGFLAWREERLGERLYEEISDETAALNAVCGEALGGMRTVRSFGQEKREERRFSSHNGAFYRLNVTLERLFGRYDAAISSLGRIMLALCLLTGGLLVMGGHLTAGGLAAALEYVNNLIWPMLEIGWVLSSLAVAKASAGKIDAVLAMHDEVPVSGAQLPMPQDHTIRFEHVGFSLDSRVLLHDVSFTVEEGRTLGIMGATGSGKSLIVNLLLRFVDPTEGCITIGGVDTRKLAPSALRRLFALVDQEAFLFSESISDNLSRGLGGRAGEADLHAALADSEAEDFVMKLPQGLDTVIGEKGVGLSGGQRQRLCLARALLRKAPVLILDDSTSALDMETEREVQRTLSRLSGMQSRIVIAHRVSSLCAADEIIVLEAGCVAERGTHASLMAQDGLYRQTCEAQYGRTE